ncbi:MAG: RluA family pseudouridine synthase [Nitrospina sp.]|nr:RluA family pseudouridine synthase [Nitrospina sp.]
MSNHPDPSLDILYLDNHLIAVRKPAGVLTQPDDSGTVSLMDQVKDWIKTEYKKPGKVFLGLVHRLDRPVSGIVVFARTSKGASRLSEQFREKTTKKIYRALVEGTPQPQQASLTHYLRKEKSLKATVFPRATPNAKEAVLDYEVIETLESTSLLDIHLHTGRFHQIRAQLAFIGHPIVGDKKYGAHSTLPEGQIALCAHRLIFKHPTSKEEISIESSPPSCWPTP